HHQDRRGDHRRRREAREEPRAEVAASQPTRSRTALSSGFSFQEITMSASNVLDNPQQPGIQSEVYLPDQLIADAKTLVSQPIVLLAGTLKRGTVLGQQNVSPISAAAKASNT